MKRLTHREEMIMQILWRLEKGFVKDIISEMLAMGEPEPPYNTISSIVRKLDTEGIVGHEAFGKTYRYFPILKKEAYRKSSFRQFIDNYFGGSKEQMLSYFVKEEQIDSEELDQLLEELKNKK